MHNVLHYRFALDVATLCYIKGLYNHDYPIVLLLIIIEQYSAIYGIAERYKDKTFVPAFISPEILCAGLCYFTANTYGNSDCRILLYCT